MPPYCLRTRPCDGGFEASRVKLLRTIPWFTRLLVGLFLAAQFAGMVSSRANALPMPAAGAVHLDASRLDASHTGASNAHHHEHAQGHSDHGGPGRHHDHTGSLADTCCALHACFAGVLPQPVAIAAETIAGEPLLAGPDAPAPGTPGGRLDRPPRPLH
jgi:hypothetical protein